MPGVRVQRADSGHAPHDSPVRRPEQDRGFRKLLTGQLFATLRQRSISDWTGRLGRFIVAGQSFPDRPPVESGHRGARGNRDQTDRPLIFAQPFFSDPYFPCEHP